MSKLNTEIPLLDLKRQYEPLYQELEESFKSFIRSGRFILGPDLISLEDELARYLEAPHTVAVSSGTDALLLCLRACGIGKDDLVLTTPFTFFATISSILATGASPVFADIDENTFCLDPVAAEEVLQRDREKKIKAIIVVHLYGQPADMDAFQKLSRKFEIPLIEDAAQSIGSSYKGKKSGNFGTCAAFSFYPTKNLGAMGDAGMVVTQEASINERLRLLRVHGSKQVYVHDFLGGNYRMDTLQAVFLRRFLPYLDSWNNKRRRLALRYIEDLKDISEIIQCPIPVADTVHGYHQYTLRIKRGSRDHLRSYLTERKIASCVYYPIPCHRQKALKEYPCSTGTFPKSELAAGQVLSVPIFPTLSTAEQDRIIESIRSWAKTHG